MNKVIPGKFKCSHCKKYFDRGKVIKQSKRVNLAGVVVQYYHCNPCNTERIRKYFNTPNGRAKMRQSVYKSMKLHKDRQNARMAVNYWIKKGTIVRPKVCPSCNKRKKTEAHHHDYTKPLEVTFMCRQCHRQEHRKLSTPVF